jgi:glutathione peroxidase
MRLVALLLVCAGCVVAVSGCGSDAGAAPLPAAVVAASTSASAGGANVLRGVYSRLNGARDDIGHYRGRVVLVVNTATECGFTPQFDGLEKLYRKLKGKGLVLLGFPANDFAGQEPRSNKDIATFCKNNYGVSFPMFAKTHVIGDHKNPLYTRLTAAAGAPEWNFNKYLLDRRGRVVARYTQNTEPLAGELVARIKKLL